jgi:hypothetical protein
MKKVALFAFNGEVMCFIHVLLNALDMKDKGYDVQLIVEGSATKLVPDLAKKSNPMNGLYEKAKAAGFIAGVCKACSQKMGTLEDAKSEGLTLLEDMNGHPGMATYLDDGFEVISF